ncbi:MAG: DUF2797 domain-containing protein [Gammaproteobacteria bacterium]
MLGVLKKMQSILDSPVRYTLSLNDREVALNALIGSRISLRFTGAIFCVHCGKATKKSFNQGYCYPCFIKLAQCDLCIVRPERCHFDAGTCREPEWGRAFCYQPHAVYLANASGIKVGITRQNQIPTRWIDQGAVQALPVFKVSSRHLSGLLEVAIGKYVSDKTSWQQMLKNQVAPMDLKARRDELLALCETEFEALDRRFGSGAMELLKDEQVREIHYPVDHYPLKVRSFNLDKEPKASGVLHGIKGQYLILDSGVINIRKFTGYEVEFSVA